MKLPNRKSAIISKPKLTEYLLSLTHKKGKSKAKFFRSIGFDESNLEKLEKSLLKIAKSNEVQRVDKAKSDILIKYVIDGFINAPNGRKYKIRTIWGIRVESKIPRFITAIPGV